MPRTTRRRIKRRLAYGAARVVHTVLVAYLDLYVEDEPDPGSGKAVYDPAGTVSGHYDVAANRDHDVLDVIAELPFGFSMGRTASAAHIHTARNRPPRPQGEP